MKVLLVEDNPADERLIQEIAKESLGEAFYFEHVNRLDSALEQLRRESFDVVLLDLGLPDSLGTETLDLMQKASGGVPIVVLTGLDEERFASEAVRAGAQDYLIKGRFDRQLLIRTVRYAIERKKAEDVLRRLNRELRAISECNQILLRATDEQSLLDEICRIVCQEAGYRMAWVAYADHDEAKSVRPVAWSGTERGYLASVGVTWADTERGRGPTGTAIRSGKSCCVQDFATDPRLAPWRESTLQHDFRSGIGLPLKDEHANPFGSLSIYSAQPNAFTSEETQLLEELAGDLAFGIVTLRSRAARKQVEQEVALLTFALDNVREVAFLIDEGGRLRYVNEEGCRVLGYSRAELLGMGVPDIDPDFPVGRWSDHWSKLKEQRSLSFESCHRSKDGRIFPVEISANYFEYGDRAYNLGLVRDITERKKAEEEQSANLHFLESMDRVNRAMQGPSDLEKMMSDVLDAVLGIFGCDRALLLYPCDPGAASWFSPMERCRPEYPRVLDLKLQMPMDPEAAKTFRLLLAANVPIQFGPQMPHPVPKNDVAERFAIKSSMSMALHPREDKAWEFGIHQCSHVRVWTQKEEELFQEIGRRLADALSVLAANRKLQESERALRRSEAYLAEAQRLSHTASWATDGKTREVLYWSEEMYRIFDFDPQKGLPTTDQAWQRIHPEDRDEVKDYSDRTFREKVDYEVEFRIVLPDGTVKHIHTLGHPVLGPKGDIVQVVGTNADITERKGAEEALRRSEAYLAEAQKLSHTGSWASDGKTREVLYWSEEMYRIFDFDPQKGLPTKNQAWQRIHPADRDKVKGHSDKTFREKSDYEVEYRIVLPDGTVKHIHSLGHPVLGPEGDIVEVVGTNVDITERQRTEEALRESETLLRTFVDHATDAFFMLDSEQGTIIDVNQPACESLGYTKQELIGMTPLSFDMNLDRATLQSVAERTAAGETVLFDRHWHRRKDGSLFPVEVHTSVFWHGGRRFLLKVARDISDRVRADEERERLRQLEADLAHINRISMMGELAASIAHEVNQPLSGVVSNGSACLRWLAGDAPNMEEAREAARRIVRDGKRAGEVIARIRALTKRTAAPREELDLNEIIREVLALVGDEAKKESVIIQTRFADDVFPVFGDRVQLQQVVLNLVMNAIEAMSGVGDRPRELLITTRNVDEDQVQVTVEDSGIGLDPDTVGKIFDPFYSTKPGGMGMGLCISRSIVEANGGRLWATGKDGPGTMFHLTVPKYHQEESNAGV